MEGVRIGLVLLTLCAPAYAVTLTSPSVSAREHYRRAMVFYNSGRFADAIAEFEKSYEESRAPNLLFDLGQAHRLNGNYAQALHLYRTFLYEQPSALNRRDVESRIAEMQKLVDAQREAALAAAKEAEAPTETETETQLATEPVASTIAAAPASAEVRVTVVPAARKMKIAGLTLLSAGLGVAVPAIYFSVSASSAASELSLLSPSGGTWSNRYQDIYDTGRRDQLISGSLFAVSGALVIAGGVLTILGYRGGVRLMKLALAAVLLVGCFSPTFVDGTVHCGAQNICPPGLECGPDGRCYHPPVPTESGADMAPYVDLSSAADLALTPDLTSSPDLAEAGPDLMPAVVNCTRPMGPWKNNSAAWPVTSMLLGNRTYTLPELVSIFDTQAMGNGLISMAHQLITAKLNLAAGAQGTAILPAVTQADSLIADLVVGMDFLSPSSTTSLTNALDAFNNGNGGSPTCP